MITDDEIQKLKAACLRLPETTVRQEELNVAGDPALMLERVCGFSSAKSATTGRDVARAQGDGFMFDAVWSFQISSDAQ